jgi:hypothetical protein
MYGARALQEVSSICRLGGLVVTRLKRILNDHPGFLEIESTPRVRVLPSSCASTRLMLCEELS